MTARFIAANAALFVLLVAPAATYSKDQSDGPLPPGQEQKAENQGSEADNQGSEADNHGSEVREEHGAAKAHQSSAEPAPQRTQSDGTTDTTTTQENGSRADERQDAATTRKESRRAAPAPPAPAANPVAAPAAPSAEVAQSAAPPANPTPIVRARHGASSTSTSGHLATRPPPLIADPFRAPDPGATAHRVARETPRVATRPSGGDHVQDTGDSVLSRTITRLVEVVPDWLIFVLALLGLLTVVFGAFLIVAGLRARRLESIRRRLAMDVSLLQSAVVPALPERIGDATVTAAYVPTEGPAAGGDFYDAFALRDGRTAVIVGDIEGHGRPPLTLASLVRYTVRSRLEAGAEPRLALQAADEVLFERLEGKLATVVAAVYSPLTGHLTYACAGHPAPVLLGQEQPPAGAATSPPIGSGAATGCRQITVALPPGTAACFYTDGLSEVRIEGTARLGYDGLDTYLDALGPDCTADDVVGPLVARHVQTDDITACVLRPLPDAATPEPERIEELEVRAADLLAARRFLTESIAEPAEADAALQNARRLIAENGAAVLEAHTDHRGCVVTVRAPATSVAA